MRRADRAVTVILAATAVLLSVYPVAASRPEQVSDSLLSPYWTRYVRRWEDVILEYAFQSGHDPDLVAAVIWKESRGLQYARGPAGAVGLMQVMPKEAGFPWRPTIEELEAPWCNIDWGTLTLAKAIRESNGDLYNALAAYNGGWNQTHLRGPRRFAGDVLGYYARAVAMRCGLPPEGYWVVTVAAVDESAQSVLTVLGPQRPLTRYSNRPVAAQIPDAATGGLPTAVAFSPSEGEDLDSRIAIWLLMDEQVVHEPEPQWIPYHQITYRPP